MRDVAVPPHLQDALQEHVQRFVDGPQGLLFPARDGLKNLSRTSFKRSWDKAQAAADRPDLRFHDLRHTGATLAAQSGATIAELMARLGHSTSAAAIRYQHAVEDRDVLVAQRMSELATAAASGT